MLLVKLNHFVLALVDRTFHIICFVVVHGVAYREATHEIADPREVGPLVFS